jgi:hypothetical protein
MEINPKRNDDVILTDVASAPTAAQYTSSVTTASISSISDDTGEKYATTTASLETIIPLSPSAAIDGKATPEQGAIIALGIICGLLIIGVLLFMVLYFSGKRYGRTTNVRVVHSSRRSRRSRRPVAPNTRRNGGVGDFEALEFPGQRDIGGPQSIDQRAMRGGYPAEMHANGLFGGVGGDPRRGYFEQGDALANAFDAPNADYGAEIISQPDPAQFRRSDMNETPVIEPLEGGLGGNRQPIRGALSPRSHRSSRLSGRENIGRGESWL